MNKNTFGAVWGNKVKLKPFHVTGTITSAAAATAVNLIPDTDIPDGKRIYLQGFMASVNGATNWATTATVTIEGTDGTDFAVMAVAALTGNAEVGPWSSNIIAASAYATGTGGTINKGLQLKGDANGTGSDLKVTVWGVIA